MFKLSTNFILIWPKSLSFLKKSIVESGILNSLTGGALLLDISFLVNRVFLNQFQVFPKVKLALFAPQPYRIFLRLYLGLKKYL